MRYEGTWGGVKYAMDAVFGSAKPPPRKLEVSIRAFPQRVYFGNLNDEARYARNRELRRLGLVAPGMGRYFPQFAAEDDHASR